MKKVEEKAKFGGIFYFTNFAPFRDFEAVKKALEKKISLFRYPDVKGMMDLFAAKGRLPISCLKRALTRNILGPQDIPELFYEIIPSLKKWEAIAGNIVPNVGLQHTLDILFNSDDSAVLAALVDPWYMGLTAATPSPAAGDTMASHGGWTEFTDYDEAVRQTYNGTRSSQTMSNSASKCSFTISQDSSSIGGGFLASSSTKSESASLLLCCAAFSLGNKAADDDDTLEGQYDFTAADDGA